MSPYTDSFSVIFSGNPYRISALLHVLDKTNYRSVYPKSCTDGYHYEDVKLDFGVDDQGKISLLSAASSNIRDTLEYNKENSIDAASLSTIANILQSIARAGLSR